MSDDAEQPRNLLRVVNGRGLQIVVEGKTLSVMFDGYVNYSSTRSLMAIGANPMTVNSGSRLESPDAEIAMFGENGEWLRAPGWYDQVKGWVPPSEVAKFLICLANSQDAGRGDNEVLDKDSCRLLSELLRLRQQLGELANILPQGEATRRLTALQFTVGGLFEMLVPEDLIENPVSNWIGKPNDEEQEVTP